jgi:hypothetical protein
MEDASGFRTPGLDNELKSYIHGRMNKMFDEVLHDVEVAVRSDYQFNTLRKRILRAGNNALRDLLSETDDYALSRKENRKNVEKFDIN